MAERILEVDPLHDVSVRALDRLYVRQGKDQKLAALLENIRSQAVPPWYSWRGAAFRMNLMNRRLRREWPMLFVGTLFLASFAALCGASPADIRVAPTCPMKIPAQDSQLWPTAKARPIPADAPVTSAVVT